MACHSTLSFSGGTLVLTGLWKDDVKRIFGDGWWVWDRRVSGWRCDACRYAQVRRRLREHGGGVDDRVMRWNRVAWPAIRLHPLRPDQEQAVGAWSPSGRGCIVMPTGTGKTEVALTIMAQTATSTLVVVPVRDLMYQWHRRIEDALGYDAGLIGDSRYRVRQVAVTTYDSACIHMDRLGDQFGLLVFDECHHLPGPVRQDAARMSAAPMRLGLTATLQRPDGRHAMLDELIGPVVYHQAVSEARGASLADYEISRIAVHLSTEEQHRYDRLARQVRGYMAGRRETTPGFFWKDLCAESATNGDAHRALMAYHAKTSIEHRAGEKLRVIEDLFRLHYGQPCIVFAGSNVMAREISRRFLIPCLLSGCGKQERRDILDGFAQGEFPAIVANRVLDEGIDVPEVKVAIVVGGMASQRQAQQRLGRILRKAGNAPAWLYEVICEATHDGKRFNRRRKCDAYQTARNRQV